MNIFIANVRPPAEINRQQQKTWPPAIETWSAAKMAASVIECGRGHQPACREVKQMQALPSVPTAGSDSPRENRTTSESSTPGGTALCIERR